MNEIYLGSKKEVLMKTAALSASVDLRYNWDCMVRMVDSVKVNCESQVVVFDEGSPHSYPASSG